MDYEDGFMLSTLKCNLRDTDWIIVKIMECESDSERTALKEKYAEVIAKRKQWRAQINQLEEELSSLNNNK